MDDAPPQDTTPELGRPSDTFTPPSIDGAALLGGSSYTYFSPVPPLVAATRSAPCVVGIDEAGRGPVLGPMVYGIFYVAAAMADTLLRTTHGFDDSKALTATTRTTLMARLCTSSSDLQAACGWGVSVLSAQDIAAAMLRGGGAAGASYNLNAQALDATVALVAGVLARGVNVAEVYVDTVGPPDAYRKKLERVFPALRITVAKKADSLYACVSAASVCAKVTRDVALETLWRGREQEQGRARAWGRAGDDAPPHDGWGSGYPSDARCQAWLRQNMHPVFGWGSECRFSWGTATDMLQAKGVGVEWPVLDADDADTHRLTDFFFTSDDRDEGESALGTWFGVPAGLEAF